MFVLSNELKDLNHENKIFLITTEGSIQNQKCILFGSQHIHDLTQFLLKNLVIIYNLEQLIFTKWDHLIIDWKYAFHIWDYSKKNIDYAQHKHIYNTHKFHTLLEIGYSPYYEIPHLSQNVSSDHIIFIGNPSSRRNWLLSTLNENILKYSHVFYSDYNDILNNNLYFVNIHSEEPAILECVRLISLLCNKKIVFSEKGCDDHLNEIYKDIIFYLEDIHYDLSNYKQYTFPKDHFETFKKLYNYNENIRQALTNINFTNL
jgi:hypothetical protein